MKNHKNHPHPAEIISAKLLVENLRNESEEMIMKTCQMLYPRDTAARRAVSMDGMWKFQIDWNQQGYEQNWKDGLPKPDMIPVPASFQDFYTEKDIREFTGDVWYETDVFVPGEWEGREVAVRFGCATHRAEVYVNGIKAVSHEGGFLPFMAEVTEIVRYNAFNKVVVLLNNELNTTSIPCGETKVLSNGKKMAKPYFDFYNYSGLQRPVKLISYPCEHIEDFSVVHKFQCQDAMVSYTVETTGNHEVSVEVYDGEGNRAASSEGKTGELFIPNVHKWGIGDGYLYRFEIRIKDGTELIDEYIEQIGIRTVEIRGKEILLNGEKVYLKGFGKHEDSDMIGRGFHPGVMKRDFECMKWIGANCFRTSHYPYSEEIYQMADREGMLVIDEVAAVGLFKSLMNFMEASTGKETSFFSEPTIPKLLENHLQCIEDMICRDKNHACVIAWSLLNEPESTDEAAVPYFEKVFEKALQMDPQKRPRTFAMIMNSLPDTCKCYQFSDFLSLNRYYGWYMMGGYEIADAEKAFRSELDGWAAKDMDKPVIFTEYGADTNSAEHKLPSVMWSQEYQVEYLKMCHRVFDSYDFVTGELVWNFADFQTTEGIMRMNGNNKGIFTRQRQPKMAAYYYKKRWEEDLQEQK